MKTVMLSKAALVGALAPALLTSCVVHEHHYHERAVVQTTEPGGEVVVTEAPPPPVVEQVTISPGPAYVWLPGVWVWHGRWIWERGHWAPRPRPGAVWVPPHYVHRGGAHVFIRGGWRY